MHTLSLEQVAHANPSLSVVHWFPGPVETSGIEDAKNRGFQLPPEVMEEDGAGARMLFLATSHRYAVGKGIVPVAENLETVKKSSGGSFPMDPQAGSGDNERVLDDP